MALFLQRHRLSRDPPEATFVEPMESIASIPSEATYVAFSGSWNLAVAARLLHVKRATPAQRFTERVMH